MPSMRATGTSTTFAFLWRRRRWEILVARTPGDTWDIATSVGFTALAVCVARAAREYGRPFYGLPAIFEDSLRTRFFTAIRTP